MPKGGPRIGRTFNPMNFQDAPASPKLDSATEDLLHIPQAEEVGRVSREAVTRILQDVPPPPWETDPSSVHHDSDARKFVEAPANVTLRWLNPKLVSQTGMRNWQAVPARGSSDFKLKLKSLAAPDNTIRRGDHQGDFLAWMYTRWVESRTRMKADTTAKKTRAAAEKHQQAQEAYAAGKFGPYITSDGGRHPTHTIADGRTMERG